MIHMCGFLSRGSNYLSLMVVGFLSRVRGRGDQECGGSIDEKGRKVEVSDEREQKLEIHLPECVIQKKIHTEETKS